MSQYLESEQIRVFPSTRREESRRFTERNLIGIISHITDVDSYVMPQGNPDSSGNCEITGPLKFVIYDYWFEEAKDGNPILQLGVRNNWTSIWATIHVDGVDKFIELQEQDDTVTGLYYGIQFTNNNPSLGTKYHSLLIAQRSSTTSTDWYIPAKYMERIRESALRKDDPVIDGGFVGVPVPVPDNSLTVAATPNTSTAEVPIKVDLEPVRTTISTIIETPVEENIIKDSEAIIKDSEKVVVKKTTKKSTKKS